MLEIMTTSTSLWQSKWFFILASIGAAAGLGNLWRFPYMVYENGGAVFIIAYIVCLFLLVIPMMMMEITIGQTERKEFVHLLSEKSGWIGRFFAWMMVLVIITLLGYYTPVAAWGLDYLFHSLTLSWANGAEPFFYENILHITDNPSVFGGFSTPVVWGLVVAYLMVFFSIFQGITSITRVIKWTVSLPFFLLAILFVNSVFLEGSSAGFAYLLIPDWSKMATITIWKDAASQAFLSANIGLIITMFYARFNNATTDIIRSTLYIALGNAAVSFLSAFAIFGTLGHVAFTKDLSITEVVASGPTLAFVAFPDALAALPFGQKIFSAVFFITIFTLAIDTIFAALEVVVATVHIQWKWLHKYSRKHITALFCILFFLWSLVFAGGNGLYRLDAIDHALWSHVFFWAVIPQIIILGWKMPISTIRKRINATSTLKANYLLDIMIKWIAPLFLIGLYISSLPSELQTAYGGYEKDFLTYWMYYPMIIIIGISIILATKKSSETPISST